MRKLFTSESVTEGHPDKICDQISDAVLDACLSEDPASKTAVECLAKTGLIVVAGEISSKAKPDIPVIARDVLRKIGYTDASLGIDADNCAVLVHIDKQSGEISKGINKDELGAGDQGMMFGYACNETPEMMPLPIMLAHKLTQKLAQARKTGIIPYLGPDGKAQVSVEYENSKPVCVHTVLVSAQHKKEITQDILKKDIEEKIIMPVCGNWINADTKILVNPSGSFVMGGPQADSGLTGRKIIVDTYGSAGRHGGGAFSGKDATKVDRSGAYAARYIAKNIVAAGLADKCEVQLAYAIGIAEPVSISINTFGTGRINEEELVKLAYEHFPLKPKQIIEHFKLANPVYHKTSCYGHFGKPELEWEKTDKKQVLQERAFGKITVAGNPEHSYA